MKTFINTHPALQKALALVAIAALVLGSAPTVFAASSINSFVIVSPILEPGQCVPVGTEFVVEGDATADTSNGGGNLNQYHVQLDWGDGSDTDDQTEESTFSLGQNPDKGTETRDFGGSHIFQEAGNYTITARIYHSQPPGQDNQADDVATIDVCIEEEVDTASITIKKDTNGTGNAVAFDFTGNLGAFSVDGDNTDTFASTSVLAGASYTITESDEPGWDFGSVSCTGSNWVAGASSVTVTPVADESVTCTFVNTMEVVDPGSGSLTIVKSTGDAQNAVEFTFELDGGDLSFDSDDSVVLGNNADYIIASDLAVGSHTVTELDTANWDFVSVSCEKTGDVEWNDYDPGDSNVTVNVQDGDNITCTFTNTPEIVDDTTVTVVKQTIPDGDQTLFDFYFGDAEVAFASLADGMSTTTVVATGTVNINEDVPEGWTLTDVTCLNEAEEEVGSLDGGIYLNLEAGDDITCTFTNTKDADPEALACTLVASDTSVEAGTDVSLVWTSQNADSASIDQGIGSVAINDSTVVTINSDITYTLTVSRGEGEGMETETCSVFINEEEDGGGGGGGGGGGKKIELDRDGGNDDEPEPEVLGESDAQTEILPAGAPNAGMGGAAAANVPALVAFFSLIASALVTRRVN